MDLKKIIHRNRAGILSALACVGVAVTAALTYLGTIKATETIKEWTEEKHDDLTTFEKAQATVPCLVPAVVAGAATIGCIVKAHRISKKEIATLTGAAAVMAKKYDDYRNANIEVNGEEAHRKVMERLGAEKAEETNLVGPCLLDNMSLNASLDTTERLFYDTITETYFTSTLARVMDAEYHINRCFCGVDGCGDVDVDKWCTFLGIPNKKKDTRGWIINEGFTRLDFSNTPVDIGDGVIAIFVECCWTPIENYWDFDGMRDDWPLATTNSSGLSAPRK